MGNRRGTQLVLLLMFLGGLLAPVAPEAQGELLVGNSGSVLVYSRTASGDTAPLRTLIAYPLGLALDLTNDELFVVNLFGAPPFPFSVIVYSRTASGDTAPLRTLHGAATGLAYPARLALDLTNNELIVVNGNRSITVYSRTASGDTAPLRTLS